MAVSVCYKFFEKSRLIECEISIWKSVFHTKSNIGLDNCSWPTQELIVGLVVVTLKYLKQFKPLKFKINLHYI
jgi:hypothetical protein